MNNAFKHHSFARSSIITTLIDEVPGITEQTNHQFNLIGYTHASQLLGQYLLLSKDVELFNAWLQNTVPLMTEQDRDDCCEAIHGWAQNNI